MIECLIELEFKLSSEW